MHSVAPAKGGLDPVALQVHVDEQGAAVCCVQIAWSYAHLGRLRRAARVAHAAAPTSGSCLAAARPGRRCARAPAQAAAPGHHRWPRWLEGAAGAACQSACAAVWAVRTTATASTAVGQDAVATATATTANVRSAVCWSAAVSTKRL
eukprot:359993-Chlamydomonas_euryale.AAC.3